MLKRNAKQKGPRNSPMSHEYWGNMRDCASLFTSRIVPHSCCRNPGRKRLPQIVALTVLVFAQALAPAVSNGDARAEPRHEETGREPALFRDLPYRSAQQRGKVPRAVWQTLPHVTGELPSEPGDTDVLRSRSVGVDASQLATARAVVAQGRQARLRLNLFPDADLIAVIDRTADTFHGYSLSGGIDGQPHGSVTLVVNDEILAGTVHSRQGRYAIAFRNGPIHTIREVAGDLNCGFDGRFPVRRAAVRQDSSASPLMAPLLDDGSEVDLLVLFTQAALELEGTLAKMRAGIDLAVAYTNNAYEASGISFRLNLVAAVQVEYQESEIHGTAGLWNQGEDMDRLIDPADGFMDEVLVLRDRYAADIVHLIVDQRGGGGMGSFLRPNAEDPAAWAVSVSNSLSDYPRFLAHEVGHVMGLRHERYSDGSPWDRLLPYAHGYVNQRAFDSGAPEESRWLTIMAYNSQCKDAGFDCDEIQRFSNPSQRYPDETGDPIGVPGDQPTDAIDGPADSVRALNHYRDLFAAFRQSATRCAPRLSEEAARASGIGRLARGRSRRGSELSMGGKLVRGLSLARIGHGRNRSRKREFSR